MAMEPLGSSENIRVMTWNIAYGYGHGSAGDHYHYRPKSEFIRRLEGMASIIRQESADIVLLQEVDFKSHRSHSINEMQFLSEKTGLQYAVSAVSWNKLYIPFPYWPPRDHFGKMLSGGAVLSRFPLSENTTHLLPKPQEFPWWYRLFYLHRYFQVVSVDIGGRQYRVINLHLEAFKQSNREHQAEFISQWIRTRLTEQELLVVGGDFNSSLGERTLDSFLALPELHEAGQRVGLNGGSFPAERPTRRLDHLFVNKGQIIQSARIIQTDNLSDHLPVISAIQLQSPMN